MLFESECPYCGEEIRTGAPVEINVEAYGSKYCNFPCSNCGNIIQAYVYVVVKARNIKKTDQESDW